MIHLVFSTKNREPKIETEMEDPLHKYLSGILRKQGSPVIAIGGMPDHVHVLFSLSRNTTIAELVRTLKADSSRWLKVNGLRKFQWQSGYGAFSVGASGRGKAVAYIRNQKNHHKKKTFKEEFLEFLRRYDIEYDERYIWD